MKFKRSYPCAVCDGNLYCDTTLGIVLCNCGVFKWIGALTSEWKRQNFELRMIVKETRR